MLRGNNIWSFLSTPVSFFFSIISTSCPGMYIARWLRDRDRSCKIRAIASNSSSGCFPRLFPRVCSWVHKLKRITQQMQSSSPQFCSRGVREKILSGYRDVTSTTSGRARSIFNWTSLANFDCNIRNISLRESRDSMWSRNGLLIIFFRRRSYWLTSRSGSSSLVTLRKLMPPKRMVRTRKTAKKGVV